ncbi:head GIN domain-containing protein [Daejeonella oryzae]|uniref:head GIN domain-containing protein n=1 Tax=Daejeonella oryzae TaxID=1122943 RepID=UPI00041D9ED0|nr:head GIN domain-containing protein [Daejeonella oryzae]
MKTLTLSFALSAVLLATSVTSSSANTLLTIHNSKKILSTEERQVSGFNGISSSGSYDVKVKMGASESLKLEGDEDLLKDIETVVENGVLKIRNKKHNTGWNWKRNSGKVTVYVTAKSLNSITLSGSGDIKVEGTVKSEKLTNTLSGSGSISLTANANEYLGNISGSGKMMISGNAKHAIIKIGGSGNFEGRNFSTIDSDVKVSGSGNVSIKAEKTLDAMVSGSGNIRYSGNAQVSKIKNGSGNITKM